jgi:hypothetical protein
MERQTVTKNKQESINSSPILRGFLQRKCAGCNQSAGGGECGECGKKKELLQRRAANENEPTEVPPIVYEVLNPPGQPLDPETRAFMEPRFRHDFSKVRIHTDLKAAESAKIVNALAYTVGTNVIFSEGQYRPKILVSKKLIAHKLTHTIQQNRSQSNIQSQLKISDSNNTNEQEANRVSKAIVQSQYSPIVSSEPIQISRETPNPEPQSNKDNDDSLIKPLTDAEKKYLKKIILGGFTPTPHGTYEALNGQEEHDTDLLAYYFIYSRNLSDFPKSNNEITLFPYIIRSLSDFAKFKDDVIAIEYNQVITDMQELLKIKQPQKGNLDINTLRKQDEIVLFAMNLNQEVGRIEYEKHGREPLAGLKQISSPNKA